MSQYTRLERLASYRYSSLWCPFVCCEENWPQASISQHFIVTYVWAEEARVFVSRRAFQPSVMLCTSLLGSLVS